MHSLFRRDPFIDLYSVSYMWYATIGVATAVFVGIIISYIVGPLKPEEIDPKLIVPMGDMCCCFLPKRWRKRLQCCVEYESYRKKQVHLFEYFHL
jgi:hypothetical protein